MEPVFGASSPSSNARISLDGFALPSYHVTEIFLPSVNCVPGKMYSMCESVAQFHWFGAEPSERTEMGAPNPKAEKTGSKMWQPMSPKVPVPKSRRLRQFCG